MNADEFTEEDYLRNQLRILHEAYAKAAKPIIDRLVLIEACKSPKPIFITIEQARDAGLMPLPAHGG